MSTVVSRFEYKTISQVILEALRERVCAGLLAPGDRLLLRPISEEFGCSEIPVREAFRSLQAEGYINLIPHVGAFVTAPDIDELVQLTEIRSILEPEATIAAAPYIGRELQDQLQGMLAEMDVLVRTGAFEEYGRLNRRFHEFIIDKAPNQKMALLVKDLWRRADRGRLVYKKGPEFIEESLRQHSNIVDAIVQKDYPALRQLVVAHSQYGLDAVRSLAAQAAARSGDGA